MSESKAYGQLLDAKALFCVCVGLIFGFRVLVVLGFSGWVWWLGVGFGLFGFVFLFLSGWLVWFFWVVCWVPFFWFFGFFLSIRL